MASGEFGLFVEAHCRRREQFLSSLRDRLQQFPGLLPTRALMVLRTYKLSFRLGEAIAPSEEQEEP